MAYLHDHKDFKSLLDIVADEMGIEAGLVEKDYWIMHTLYGLKKQGFQFELKGGTSLSKGFHIIDRFSEDIDIHITPDPALNVIEDPSKNKQSHIDSRANFFEWLVQKIQIDGIISQERDHEFDNITFTSGGIRLYYENRVDKVKGAKEGILLEAGFDTVTPNSKLTISSWALDRAKLNDGIEFIDNTAVDIICYDPGYTFVEKLQTVATKYRQEQTDGKVRKNYMRQYYDLHCLLNTNHVQEFIKTEAYQVHKKARFPKADYAIPISENQAFLLSDPDQRAAFQKRYLDTSKLYYKGQPDFEDLLTSIHKFIHLL
ncbi:MAG: hypothetical protein B7Y76_08910 [Sphingobacteriia bacterium 35-40-5]|jgi:hypothetical protein|nr:MAG: hypothetical protein B7Y76_08910 [Sphingobacteriia bacterium 35-40-5]